MTELVVRCRGLPFTATENDVKDFLGTKGIKKVHLTSTREGRPSGEAFVVVEDQEAYTAALAKNRGYIGTRYIEVFSSSPAEMSTYTQTASAPSIGPVPPTGDASTLPSAQHCVRLRGLPFNCTREEIRQFFSPLTVVQDGIVFPHERLGRRSTGEAFVFFDDPASATKALEKNKESIQHRYIEVFSSSRSDCMRALEGQGSITGRGGPGGPWEGGARGRGGVVGGAAGYDPYAAVAAAYGPRAGHPRPSPYDRPAAAAEVGYGGYPSHAAAAAAYAAGTYDYGYGYEGYGYENGDWAGYAASYDYGPRHPGGGVLKGRSAADIRRLEERGPPKGEDVKYTLKMRGIPFRAVQGDIYEFFSPLRPASVEILKEPGGRMSGEARVEFLSKQDYYEALQKDKQYMGSRYVDIFPLP